MTRKKAVADTDFDDVNLGIEDMMDLASTGGLEDGVSGGTASNSGQRLGGWDAVGGLTVPPVPLPAAPMTNRSMAATPRKESSHGAVPGSPFVQFEGINSGDQLSAAGSSNDHEALKLPLSHLSEAWCKLHRADKLTEKLASMAVDTNEGRNNPRFSRIFNDFLSIAEQATNHMNDVGYTLRFKKSYMTKGAVTVAEVKSMLEETDDMTMSLLTDAKLVKGLISGNKKARAADDHYQGCGM